MFAQTILSNDSTKRLNHRMLQCLFLHKSRMINYHRTKSKENLEAVFIDLSKQSIAVEGLNVAYLV